MARPDRDDEPSDELLPSGRAPMDTPKPIRPPKRLSHRHASASHIVLEATSRAAPAASSVAHQKRPTQRNVHKPADVVPERAATQHEPPGPANPPGPGTVSTLHYQRPHQSTSASNGTSSGFSEKNFSEAFNVKHLIYFENASQNDGWVEIEAQRRAEPETFSGNILTFESLWPVDPSKCQLVTEN